jgi:ABC-type lipoprotein export system ATPase subunit
MVTHDAYAASYADRVVFLKDGRLVRQLQRSDAKEGAVMQAIMDVMGHLESNE